MKYLVVVVICLTASFSFAQHNYANATPCGGTSGEVDGAELQIKISFIRYNNPLALDHAIATAVPAALVGAHAGLNSIRSIPRSPVVAQKSMLTVVRTMPYSTRSSLRIIGMRAITASPL